MSFLETWQKKQSGNNIEHMQLFAKDKDVIGGGDTGCDCIATSLRQVRPKSLHLHHETWRWCASLFLLNQVLLKNLMLGKL